MKQFTIVFVDILVMAAILYLVWDHVELWRLAAATGACLVIVDLLR